jgi:fructose-1,6-bisphosphatase/inositol monophosphatase family enzyme
MTTTFGDLNGHAVGILMKEVVRRAILTVRTERQVFEVTAKAGYAGDMTDVFTTADSKAQAVYLRTLRECFPDFGIVAEEDGFSVDARNGCTGFFTVDPLDGTKAFIRRQSHGIGTMIALVDGGQVIAAYIGDISTQEIYGFRPGSPHVHRISEFETSQRLTHEIRPLTSQYVLLRDPEPAYGAASQTLIRRFKAHQIDGGSIGIWMSRLWKREVGAVLIPPSVETPWDSAPVIGISQALGYEFLRPTPGSKGWEPFTPAISAKPQRRDHDMLVLHHADLAAARDILNA